MSKDDVGEVRGKDDTNGRRNAPVEPHTARRSHHVGLPSLGLSWGLATERVQSHMGRQRAAGSCAGCATRTRATSHRQRGVRRKEPDRAALGQTRHERPNTLRHCLHGAPPRRRLRPACAPPAPRLPRRRLPRRPAAACCHRWRAPPRPRRRTKLAGAVCFPRVTVILGSRDFQKSSSGQPFSTLAHG